MNALPVTLAATATAVPVVFAFRDLRDGIEGMLIEEHSHLSHRQLEILDPELQRELDRKVYYGQVGSTSWLWAIVHRLHHMFGDVRGLDYYSWLDRGFLRTLGLSAVYVHEAKHVEGVYELFPDLIPNEERAALFASCRKAWLAKVVKFGIVPVAIALPTKKPRLIVATLAGSAFVGTMSVMGIMFGGGAINSIAHWMFRAEKRGYRKALDGTTAADHPWLAKWTKLRELFHRTHHDKPTELNFAIDTPGGVDVVYQRCLELERQGRVAIRYCGDDPDIEMFNLDAIAAFVRKHGNREDLQRWYGDVTRHISPQDMALLTPIEADRFRHYAEVGALILRGRQRENAGLVAA